MKRLLAVFFVISVLTTLSYGEDKVLIVEENPNCSFSQILKSQDSENYLYIVGIVVEKTEDSLTIKPVRKKGINKIILRTTNINNYKVTEKIKFFIVDKKACIENSNKRY